MVERIERGMGVLNKSREVGRIEGIEVMDGIEYVRATFGDVSTLFPLRLLGDRYQLVSEGTVVPQEVGNPQVEETKAYIAKSRADYAESLSHPLGFELTTFVSRLKGFPSSRLPEIESIQRDINDGKYVFRGDGRHPVVGKSPFKVGFDESNTNYGPEIHVTAVLEVALGYPDEEHFAKSERVIRYLYLIDTNWLYQNIEHSEPGEGSYEIIIDCPIPPTAIRFAIAHEQHLELGGAKYTFRGLFTNKQKGE